MPLSELIGNASAKTTLLQMVEKQAVPSTLLFYGPEGVGKGRFALALSELLMGPKSAAKLKSGLHPDLHLLRPTGKGQTHPIEQIRALIDEAALPPFEAPIKMFIIDEAHLMLPSSGNALLKVLEEPYSHSYFILITSDAGALLPTLVSRCRKIPFFPLSQTEIEQGLRSLYGTPSQEARRAAFLARGSFALAKQLIEHPKLPWKEPLLTLLTLTPSHDDAQMGRLFAELEGLFAVDDPEKEDPSAALLSHQIEYFLEEIVMWYRDLHLLKEGVATEHLYHLDHLDSLKLVLSQPLPSLEKILDKMATARLALQRHVHLRSVLEYLFTL